MLIVLYTIVVPLAVVSIPENVTVNASGHAYFNASFAGTNIINITWVSPSGSIIESIQPDIVVSSSVHPTEASSLLNISNIQRNQFEGWYRCVCFALNGSGYAYIEVDVFMFVQGTLYYAHTYENQISMSCSQESNHAICPHTWYFYII